MSKRFKENEKEGKTVYERLQDEKLHLDIMEYLPISELKEARLVNKYMDSQLNSSRRALIPTPFAFFARPFKFLEFLNFKYHKKQFDIFDYVYQKELKKLKISRLRQVHEVALQNFKKNPYILQNFVFLNNPKSYFYFNEELEEEVEGRVGSLFHLKSEVSESLAQRHYKMFRINTNELLNFLKLSSEEQGGDILVYIDFCFYNVDTAHIACCIYNHDSRVMLLLNTAYDDKILPSIKDLFENEFNIQFLFFPKSYEINLQKIDETEGNCSQWRFVIAYEFTRLNIRHFFGYYKDNQNDLGLKLILEFYAHLNSFTTEQFNEIAANFLCYDPVYLKMAQSKINYKELYPEPEIVD